MSPSDNNHDPNVELARAINLEARGNPHSPYAGKYVAIARGIVVAVGAELADVLPVLNESAPNRDEGLVIEASADYDGPHEIWSM